MDHRDQILKKLLEWIETTGDGGFLIINPAEPEGVYVQFNMGAGGADDVIWEAISNEYLPEAQQLDHAQQAALGDAGFLLRGNYQQIAHGPLSEDDVRSIADTSANIIHTVYLVPEDAPLEFNLWLGPDR